jgi:carboxymethylenebutenolidase
MQSVHSGPKMLTDIGSYLDHFAGAKCGTTGYCMGGRLSITAATMYPDRIAAAAAYHPGGLVTDAPDSPHLQFGKIKAKVYIGGAIEDANFTDEQRKTCDDALTAAGVDHQVELYQAKHGWVPKDMPVHDDAAEARHWETLIALFKRALS